MKKIVITGGPCGGKTTCLKALQEEFMDKIIFVPEVATILLGGGFPLPGKHLEWSEKWQATFQASILPLQVSFEDAFELVAQSNGNQLMICDRGILDGAAYTPGGLEEFSLRYNLDINKAIARYTAVIHLESLATSDPERYGKTGNDSRFESFERAQEIEHATRATWIRHNRHLFINGQQEIKDKISKVIDIVRYLITE